MFSIVSNENMSKIITKVRDRFVSETKEDSFAMIFRNVEIFYILQYFYSNEMHEIYEN